MIIGTLLEWKITKIHYRGLCYKHCMFVNKMGYSGSRLSVAATACLSTPVSYACKFL